MWLVGIRGRKLRAEIKLKRKIKERARWDCGLRSGLRGYIYRQEGGLVLWRVCGNLCFWVINVVILHEEGGGHLAPCLFFVLCWDISLTCSIKSTVKTHSGVALVFSITLHLGIESWTFWQREKGKENEEKKVWQFWKSYPTLFSYGIHYSTTYMYIHGRYGDALVHGM